MSFENNNYKIGIDLLRKKSDFFGGMYDKLGFLEQRWREASFEAFVATIIGQQLSGKAADTIYARLLGLSPGDITPNSLQVRNVEELRSVGISNAKARYILKLAEKFVTNEISIEDFATSTNIELYNKLNNITGIGPWSARIIMLFNFNRLEAFPFGDTTLEKTYSALSGKDVSMLQDEVKEWQPYSGIVAMYMWSFADNIGLNKNL